MTALDDTRVDRLLASDRPPPMPASLADRIAAEATRPGRVPAMSAQLARRPRRRLWARPRFIAGFVAFNLVAASAVAAAIGGHVIEVPRQLAALSTTIFQPLNTAAPAVHRAAKPKSAKPARTAALAQTDPPSAEADQAPPPPDGVRPRGEIRRDLMALRALAREQRLERHRERALALAQMTRAERLRAIEEARKARRTVDEQRDSARQARALVREKRLALRRDQIAPSREELEALRRELEPRRAELAKLRAELRDERRLERLRRFQEWREQAKPAGDETSRSEE